jgi:Zn-dependent metalloprotease
MASRESGTDTGKAQVLPEIGNDASNSLFTQAITGTAPFEGTLGGIAILDPSGIQRLKQDTGDAQISIARQTGAVRFVRLTPEQAQQLSSRVGAAATVESQAAAFFGEYGSIFGIRDAEEELVLGEKRTDSLGFTHLTYNQSYKGVPVFAGLLRVHFDDHNRITAVNGMFIPQISLNTTPSLAAEESAAKAVNQVVARGVSARQSTLYVFRTNLARGVPGTDHLVYEVEVGNGHNIREFVYVDAHSGKVVDQITGVYETLTRYVYNIAYDPANLVWEEGDPLPFTGTALVTETQVISDVNRLIEYAEDTYELGVSVSGGTYLSYDGQDAAMHSVADSPFGGGCPNASWNGTYTQYCEGVSGDDTVAHEWGHAYTDYTHNLIYQWQPGALNESYSDIIGEVVDMINGSGLDSPDTLRSAGACSVYTPFPALLRVNAPITVAGHYTAGPANFGPPLTLEGITGTVVLVDDGDDEGGDGTTTDGCQTLTNAGAINGNIALIDRGACNFTVKVKNAQDAGAIGAIVANHATGGDAAITMGGTDPTITIPSLFIGHSDGNTIKAELSNNVSATLTVDPGSVSPDDSYRWLSGEDDVGGAIRDMWNPNCYGDPGKVSDTEYVCSTSDQGGVHTNSGVSNHAFSLLVDGGSYNGQTVASIGMTKTFHIYWRAMTVYQNPASDFVDHADSLEQSCQDLIGTDLVGLTTGTPSGEVIASGDCTQVANAIAAVEFRTLPTQCTFEPLLDQTPPALCASGTEPVTSIYTNTFETVTTTWALENVGVYAEYQPVDWSWVTDLPGGRSGYAFFGADPLSVGDCTPGSDDQSGVKYLTSPEITIPVSSTRPRLVFEHYVATEADYDGGNLWISVNGGNWQIIDAGDFTFNPYNGTLETAEDGNTNPLAGQRAFHGSDGGSVEGTWGESHVDLGPYVERGDTIRLRFALGVDGCNGIDGWYVDDVQVYYCAGQADPEISVDLGIGTTELSVQMMPDHTADKTFSITNWGTDPLNWSITEDLVSASQRGVSAMVQNVVVDGSFEAGSPNPYWDEVVTTIASPLCDPASCGYDLAYDGSWYAWFGGWGALHITALTQTVNISSTGRAELSFWLMAFPSGSDVLTVSIDSTPVFTVTAANAGPYGSYAEVIVDVSAFADGGDHVLSIGAATVGNIFLDYVILDNEPYCVSVEEIPWLSLSPSSGTTLGDSSQITATFDATGMALGSYQGYVCITSNDPGRPLVSVPASLDVVQHDLYLPIVMREYVAP